MYSVYCLAAFKGLLFRVTPPQTHVEPGKAPLEHAHSHHSLYGALPGFLLVLEEHLHLDFLVGFGGAQCKGCRVYGS